MNFSVNAKIGRNDLCTCGSGKKYKRCSLAQQWIERRRTALIRFSDAHSDMKRVPFVSSGLFEATSEEAFDCSAGEYLRE